MLQLNTEVVAGVQAAACCDARRDENKFPSTPWAYQRSIHCVPKKLSPFFIYYSFYNC